MKISTSDARERLAVALAWAKSTREVPEDWTLRAREIGRSPSKTFVAALVTAALARATTSEVDALWLKVAVEPRSYSARTLCHNVLVPASDLLGFSLGATGREPLNNQPFFRYDRIDRMDRVHPRAQHHHSLLVDAVVALNSASPEDSLGALAAILRTRLTATMTPGSLDATGVSYRRMIDAVERLLLDDAEQGRRAQAVVAAAFDMVFDQIRVERVNSPSRHYPGDVVAIVEGRAAVSAEVKHKPVQDDDVRRFAKALQVAAIGRGMMVALAPNPHLSARGGLEKWAREETGVALSIQETVHGLFIGVLGSAPKDLSVMLLAYPDRLARRLRQLESPAGLAFWNSEW